MSIVAGSLSHIELSLVHDDIEGREVLVLEVDGRAGHMRVHHLRDQAHVPGRIREDSVHEAAVLGCAKSLILPFKILT